MVRSAFVVGAVAGIAAFVAAQPYVGATVDSGEYLAVAEGIVDGHGLTMPYVGYDEPFRVLEPGERVHMTQFPPLYPVLLALTQWLGFAALDGARFLAACCFAITGWAAATLVFGETKSVRSVVTVGGLLVTSDLVIVHSMAWSETVMLTSLMGALFFSVRYFRAGRTIDLVAAGGSIIVASGTRFVGLSAGLAVTVGLLVASRGPLSERLRRAFVFGAACVAPTIAWFIRNRSILGSPSEKEVGWYLPGLAHVEQAFATVGGWAVPWKEAKPWVGAVLVIAGIVMGRRKLRPAIASGPTSVPRACIWFGAGYVFFVLLSRTVLDQNIALDFRILSPVYVLLAIGLCSVLKDPGRIASAAIALMAVIAVARGADTVRSFSDLSVAAYTGDAWRESPTLRYAGSVAPGTLLVTNAPDPIWIWHERTSMIIPPRSSLYSGEPNDAYDEDVEEMLEATRCRRAIVVFFDQPTRKPRRYIEPLLVRGMGLTRIERFSDGEIYDIAEPKCEAEA